MYQNQETLCLVIRENVFIVLTIDFRISSQMNLPNLPDMVFSKNGLSIIHEKGYGLRFDPIDALKTVNAHEDLVHVAMSKEWLEARSDHADINKIAKRYDWTFTPTDYKGTLTNEANEPCSNSSSSAVVDEKIDYEKLKVQEKILFFDEIILYEDELDDNGVAKLSIKIVRLFYKNFNFSGFLICPFHFSVEGHA